MFNLQSKKTRLYNIKQEDGKTLTFDLDKAQILNKFFVKQTDLNIPKNHYASLGKPNTPKPNDCLSKLKVRHKKVLRLLLKLNPSKATGSDRIPALYLKNTAHHTYKVLARIFQLSLKLGIFPSAWKIADVVAIHKKKSKSEPGNYRPISLLAIVSKLFETIVADCLKFFLAPKLSPNQFGFRPGHTTLDLLLLLTQSWTNALASGKEVRSVALDISKAFDKVWHDGLLFKLAELGIAGSLLDWLRSYLSDRKQRVIINTDHSDLQPIKAGVPQGSVLGPLLFLVFINDLFSQVSNHLDVFADDSTLWSIVDNDRKEVAESLNRDLDAIQSWAEKWIVKYNHTKTELLTISRKRDVTEFRRVNVVDPDTDNYFSGPIQNPHPPIRFAGCVLQESSLLKLVGLTFTSNLTWTKHVNNIYRNASKNIALLHRANLVCSKEALATIYKSHIRSRLEYCCPIWMGSGTTVLSKLDRVQERAGRILGAVQYSRLHSLHHRRVVSSMCALHRIYYKRAPVALHHLCPSRAPAPRAITRSSTKLPQFFKQPKLSTAKFYRNSFIPRATTAWNTVLLESTQNMRHPQKFKERVNSSSLTMSRA